MSGDLITLGVEDFGVIETNGDKPEISWFTPPGISHTGYGVAAINLIEAIQRKEIRVTFATSEPYVHVSFVQPEWYRLNPSQHVIGYTPWESTEIPHQWHHYMNQCQEIWTTSQFCAEVFNNSGIEPPISVIPHGVDPEVWKIQDREIGDKFRFLHIGGDTVRKNGQMVADAFLDCFDGNTDVELVMKSHGPNMARWRKNDFYGGNIGHHPQVHCITETLDGSDAVANLYAKCHCMVYPTNGEGFGFIPFDAIATGMPTICTDLTGCQDFASMSMPLRATWGPGVGLHLGDWAIPDPDHLRELMLDAVNNWTENKKKAMQSAKIIHTTMTWDNIASQVTDNLGDKVNKRAS